MTNANPEFAKFIKRVEEITAKIESFEQVNDVKGLKDLIANFKLKTDDFYRKERKLNVGVVGQVKAGKSSFLNTLLFEGK